ncbi:hypothetical protein OXX80_002391 [Metschnikowia pulcherrima]
MKVLAALAAVLSLGAISPVLAAQDASASLAPEIGAPVEKREENPAETGLDSAQAASEEKQLPEELTLETFDSFTTSGLTLVEFYSPYCSHCKTLAPKWKEAYFLTEKEQESSKIYMRQVNCVESGDLCAREDINFYPNLRLYAPDTKNGGKSRFVDSYPAALARTPDNFRKYLKTAVAEYNSATLDLPSLSEEMDIDLAMRVVAGEAQEPYFVALFSSSTENYERGKFPDSCLNCIEHRQIWDRLSNLVATSARTAHLNCHTYPLVCEKLGFAEMGRRAKSLSPRYIMFVPKSAGLIRFDYPHQLSLPDMKAFVVKLATNYKYDQVTSRGLEDSGFLVTELPEEPQDVYYPISNKMALVFWYDISTVTPEDKAILPYLLETVMKLPFDISLYESFSPKLQNIMEYQAKGLVQYVNSDETFANVEFNRHLHLATSLSANPTLYIFKENSLIPAIYQNFALEDMRDADKVENFVKKNMYPTYGELTPKNYNAYFFKKGKKNRQNDKVVITFLNTDDATAIKHTLFNLSMIAHQYHAEKSRFYFEDLLEERDKKHKKVAQMKENNAKTTDIIQQMRKLVPHLFSHNEVLFTYVDMVQHPHFAKEFGLNIDGGDYKTGDTIIVSKAQKLYWDKDFNGVQLTSDRQSLREVLKALLSPKLVPEKPKLRSKLVGSPYHRHLRGADFVHQHGFFGYLFFGLIVFMAYQGAKKLIRKPAGNRRGGIIGNVLAKSD